MEGIVISGDSRGLRANMKTFNPLVSCVIPVYNAEKYLDQGINSLLAQTYDNLEIILVDDKSTDDSWQLCKRYEKKYPNVRAFQNSENAGGPLRGRERGIHEAQGEWITFMDCDDYVEPTYIEHLVNATRNGKFDIAVTGHSRLYSDGRIEDFLWSDYSQTTDERLAAFYRHFLTNDFWTDPTDTVGQNLIRASICKKTDLSKYPNLVWAEDTLMALAFLANSKKGVNFVDKHDFVWRQVEGSGSHGGFSDRADRKAFYKACYDIFHNPDTYRRFSKLHPLVSVIVPVYNVEPYLRECLDSILNQTYQNIEVIIINDGSPDNAQRIIDEYENGDSRIVTIKQENKGLNMARAAGVKIANGEYVTFIDSDDMIHPCYIRVLYECLVKHDSDISIVGYSSFVDSTKIIDSSNLGYGNDLQVIPSNRELLRCLFGQVSIPPNVYSMTAWGKLYKANIINSTDWEFSNYRRNEDNFEVLQWYSAAMRGAVISSSSLYFYRQNPNSITQNPKLNTNPKGESINYFEYLNELYEKTKQFVHDETLNDAILGHFAETNSIQLRNFALNHQLRDEDVVSAALNMEIIVNIYKQRITMKDELIDSQESALKGVYGSASWRVTSFARKLKTAYSRKKHRF